MLSLLLLFLLPSSQWARSIDSPPQLVRQPPRDELLFQVARTSEESDTPFVIECEAKGHPTPRYTWHKNGQPYQWSFYSSRVSQQPGQGTLVITAPRDSDAGVYQCFASNKYGTAVSYAVHVRKSELGSFKNQPAISISANEGDRLRLGCDPPEGYPPPTIYWMILSNSGGFRSINSSRMTVDADGNLWFSNVTRQDESGDSVYACSATSPFKTEYKVGNRVRLTVVPAQGLPGTNRRPPHEQYVSPRNITALRGKQLKLSCIYGGTPLPGVQWQRYDGRLSVTGDRIRVVDYGKSLLIDPVTMDDEGDYVCTVSNGVGQTRTETFSVKLQAEPYFIKRPRLQMAAEGESVVFECQAQGVPAPTVSWTVNGRPLADTEPNTRRSVSADGSRLTLVDLKESDRANYGCNATNTLGYDYQDVYVNVLALPAEIIQRPMDRAVVLGGNVELTCVVFGAPSPSVTWRKAAAPADTVSVPVSLGAKFTVNQNGTLKISGVEYADGGTYVCVAKNKFGQDSANSSLVVREHTRIDPSPQSRRVIAGSAVTFTCRPVTDPALTARVTWLADGWKLDPNLDPRYQVSSATGSLTVTRADVSASRNYTCLVLTELDQVNATAQLVVEDIPEPPTLVHVTCREREADVEWRSGDDNNSPITGFIIQANTSFSPEQWITLANPPAPSSSSSSASASPATSVFTVPLSPWANYTVRVLARNSVGPSLPSSLVTSERRKQTVCRTPPALPDKNPQHVKARGTEPDNLVISWKSMPPVEHNAPGFHYRVSWRQDRVGEPWHQQLVYDWRQQSHLVADQPTYSAYWVRVEALNELGASVVAAEQIRGWSGEDVPLEAPSNFNISQIVDGRRAVFTWSPVQADSLRGEFRGYKIETWPLDAGRKSVTTTVFSATVTHGTVATLQPYSQNRALIRVFNGAYPGPASRVLTFRMPEGVPGAVASLEAVPLAADSLYVTWSPPAEVNGQLTGYRLSYQLMTGVVEGPVLESPLPSASSPSAVGAPTDLATTAVLAGLDTNATYRLTVVASTKAGAGTPYYIERSTRSLPPRRPDRPGVLWTYVAPDGDHSDHRIRVTWLPAVKGHPGSHFFAQHREAESEEWLSTDAVLDRDHVLLRRLRPTVLYQLRTVAVDGPYQQPSHTVQAVASAGAWPAVVEASAGHVTSAGWFIGAVCAATLLLLVLLLSVLVCAARRRRGGKYNVYNREVAYGRRDLNDEKGFQELRQPLDCVDGANVLLDNGSGGTGGSGSGVGGGVGKSARDSEDSDSMAEYGDDTGKFTEDGSFIGQYGAQKRNGVAYV